MKTVAIIQARMSSARLPGKVLLSLEGVPVLGHVINRVRSCSLIDRVVVATSVNPADLPIVALCASNGVSVYCGLERNVLNRYYQAACLFDADVIVRITADCPMIDPVVIGEAIDFLLPGIVYVSNAIEETFPDGMDVEVFTMSSLEKLVKQVHSLFDREHVTSKIRRKSYLFGSIASYNGDINLGHHRWTLDEPADYEFMKAVFAGLYYKNPLFGMNETLDFLALHPKITALNSHIKRNEGSKQCRKF